MYRCEFCGNLSKPNKPSHTVVTKRRKVLYGLFDKNQNQIGKKLGWEAVQEAKICNTCNKKENKK